MKKVINVGIIGRNFGYNVIYKAIQNDKSFKVIGFSYKNNQKKITYAKILKFIQIGKN